MTSWHHTPSIWWLYPTDSPYLTLPPVTPIYHVYPLHLTISCIWWIYPTHLTYLTLPSLTPIYHVYPLHLTISCTWWIYSTHSTYLTLPSLTPLYHVYPQISLSPAIRTPPRYSIVLTWWPWLFSDDRDSFYQFNAYFTMCSRLILCL